LFFFFGHPFDQILSFCFSLFSHCHCHRNLRDLITFVFRTIRLQGTIHQEINNQSTAVYYIVLVQLLQRKKNYIYTYIPAPPFVYLIKTVGRRCSHVTQLNVGTFKSFSSLISDAFLWGLLWIQKKKKRVLTSFENHFDVYLMNSGTSFIYNLCLYCLRCNVEIKCWAYIFNKDFPFCKRVVEY